MNPEGHERIANDVGLPILVAAFRERGHERIPLNAFPLGNWLTDVQQFVDPVVANPELAKRRLGELADEIVSSIFFCKPGPEPCTPGADPSAGWIGTLQGQIAEVVRARQRSIEDALEFLLAATGAPEDTRRNLLFDAFRLTFRIWGYLKFVHPVTPSLRLDHEPRTGDRMSVDAYFAIFEELFTQYYPHDHMDRPELRNPPQDPPDYRSEIATGPRAQGPSNLVPDLYLYLREDIEIAAGRLARAEVDFAQAMFDVNQRPRPYDIGWNMALARFGRALHSVEDFFAHSNFTEQAATLLGRDHIPSSNDIVGRQIFQLRLLQWQRIIPGQPVPTPVTESNLVTGWFDMQDTIISLIHGVELMFGVRLRNPQVRVADALAAVRKAGTRQDVLLFDAQQLLYETSELLDNPRRALEDRENSVAQRVRDQIPVTGLGQPITEDTVRRLLRDSPVFQAFPVPVQTDMVNVLVALHGAYQIGSTTYTAYKAIKSIYDFVSDPLATALGWVRTALGEAIAEAVQFYAEDRVLAILGSRRVGCHSLIAKDHDEAVLHDHSWNLAAGVHWYVLSVFARRHPDLPPLPQSRQDVDWFDLLEFFLRHPRGGRNLVASELNLCAPAIHVVDNIGRLDTLATLGIRYARTSCASGSFSWKTIADANFKTAGRSVRDTQRIVNRVLATRGTGYVVRDGINYAFKPGLLVVIPNQRLKLDVYRLEDASTIWWREVLTAETWKVFPGFEDPDQRMSRKPLEIGNTPRRLNSQQARTRLREANALQRRREESYR
jgi:hypothetical protein